MRREKEESVCMMYFALYEWMGGKVQAGGRGRKEARSTVRVRRGEMQPMVGAETVRVACAFERLYVVIL